MDIELYMELVVHSKDPCPLGLPEILTMASVCVPVFHILEVWLSQRVQLDCQYGIRSQKEIKRYGFGALIHTSH